MSMYGVFVAVNHHYESLLPGLPAGPEEAEAEAEVDDAAEAEGAEAEAPTPAAPAAPTPAPKDEGMVVFLDINDWKKDERASV